MQMDPGARQAIQDRINRLRESPEAFLKQSQVADRFLPLITQELTQSNIPPDFKYLSLSVQSDSLAFWDMSERLAQILGLTVDQQVDERQNIWLSTRQLANRWQQSYPNTPNWLFILLSYELSPEEIQLYAQKKYPGLRFNESAQQKSWIVSANDPAILLKYLAHRFAFGFMTGRSLDIDLELIPYETTDARSIQQIADAFFIPVATLKKYNSWLKTDLIPPAKAYPFTIPMPGESPSSDVRIYSSFRGEVVYQTAEVSFLHIVEPGQTLYGIARLYRIALDDLMRWNKLSKNDVLAIGQQLVVVGTDTDTTPDTDTEQPDSDKETTPKPTPDRPEVSILNHSVQKEKRSFALPGSIRLQYPTSKPGIAYPMINSR
ncbi:MAG: LysM peptidoglycan-binding domain-containing protein [Bacteroidia bacterium]|nr:LysM peptidoglycan-binding domain-containing protein [Bacteroidia bacterium]